MEDANAALTSDESTILHDRMLRIEQAKGRSKYIIRLSVSSHKPSCSHLNRNCLSRASFSSTRDGAGRADCPGRSWLTGSLLDRIATDGIPDLDRRGQSHVCFCRRLPRRHQGTCLSRCCSHSPPLHLCLLLLPSPSAFCCCCLPAAASLLLPLLILLLLLLFLSSSLSSPPLFSFLHHSSPPPRILLNSHTSFLVLPKRRQVLPEPSRHGR